MKYSGDLSAYTLGGTSYLADFDSVTFEIGSSLEEGKGGAQRHSNDVIVKQEFHATASLMRTVSTVRQTTLNVDSILFGATDIEPDLRSLTITVNNTLQECSARSDRYNTYQATGTKFTGSGTLQVQDAATTDLIETLAGALSGLATTINGVVGGTTFELPITISKAGYKIDRDDLYMIDFEFTQRGTPTTLSGNTLFALALTGTTLCAIVSTVSGLGNRSGSTAIESMTWSIPEQGILKETYNFKGLGAPTIT